MQQTNQPLDPALTKDLMQHTYNSDGLELECWLEYEGAEGDGWHEPHYDESAELVYATVAGINIAGLLSDDMVAAIEKEALKGMATAAFDAAFDQAVDRAADKAEFEKSYT